MAVAKYFVVGLRFKTFSEKVAYLTACNVTYDISSFYQSHIPIGTDIWYPVGIQVW